MLVPVAGVDLVADDGVAVLLNLDYGRGLVIGLGLLVDIVRRTEVEWLHAQLAGKQASGQLHLQVQLARRDFAYVRMAPRVVADLVALARDPLQHADMLGGIGSDDHERALDLFLFEDVEDLRRPFGVGPVIE